MKQNKVLLIDDDKDLCLLIERELRQENYEVMVCNDGKTEIGTFNNSEYQIIVLDIFALIPPIKFSCIIPWSEKMLVGSEIPEIYMRLSGVLSISLLHNNIKQGI